jgi:hypothetical protein
MSKHTPGPWVYDPESNWVEVVETQRVICQLFNRTDDDFWNGRNNGPLLAEAPAMYHAINMMLGAFQDETGDATFFEAIEEMEAIFARINGEVRS